MKQTTYKTIKKESGDKTLLLNPQFWSLVVIFVLLTLHYYDDQTSFRIFSSPDMSLGVTRHTIDRILYLVPIALSSLIFGLRGGFLMITAAFLAMIPRAIFISSTPMNALWETLVITLIGSLVPLGLEHYKEQEEQLEVTKEQLESTQRELSSATKISQEQEKQLSAINTFTAMLSQSLDLEQVLQTTIDMVMDIMHVDVVLVFSLAEDRESLKLISYTGVQEKSAENLDGMRLGENPCGRVAETGEPFFINDLERDPDLSRLHTLEDDLKAELSVPLLAHGEIVGTLCVATRSKNRLRESDIELLSALGKLIGIAIHNARLQENQTFYLQQITRAHEDERQRISRDLHDSTAQNLIGMLRVLERFCEEDKQLSPERLEILWKLHVQLKNSLKEIRQLGRDLRPLVIDDLGFLPAVEWLTERLKTEHKLDARLIVRGEEKRFSSEIEITLFRIVQEGLRNIAKHANASEAQVAIEFKDSETRLIITDNGKGFELPTSLGELSRLGKLGVDGIQTRVRLVNGNLSVNSKPGKGTSIVVSIPA